MSIYFTFPFRIKPQFKLVEPEDGRAHVYFPKGHIWRYWQDFRPWEWEIPADIAFYPVDTKNNQVELVGDGYGAIPSYNNIQGEYGGGPIFISIDHLPKDVVEFCKKHTQKS